jgi:hypothetical protein
VIEIDALIWINAGRRNLLKTRWNQIAVLAHLFFWSSVPQLSLGPSRTVGIQVELNLDTLAPRVWSF